MLSLENRALDIKLSKIHTNRDNRAYFEKEDFQWKLVFQIRVRYWICSVKTSPRVVLVLDSESQLVLQVKRGKVELAVFTIILKKLFFLQTTSNIDILYIIGAFLSTIKNLRSLPQNKASFSSNQLEKFHRFAWKNVLMIRVLSS